jgi:hypothetical protein
MKYKKKVLQTILICRYRSLTINIHIKQLFMINLEKLKNVGKLFDFTLRMLSVKGTPRGWLAHP